MNIPYEAILYRYLRIYGYGDSFFIPNRYFSGDTDLSAYETYFDFVRDFHDNYWPDDQDRPENFGKFDILSHDPAHHNMIFKNVACTLVSFNAARYIISKAYDSAFRKIIDKISCNEEALLDRWHNEQSHLLATKLNENDDWCAITQYPKQHGDELVIVFSSQRAMKQIRLNHFMNDVEAILTSTEILDIEIKKQTEKAQHFLNLMKPYGR